MSYLNIPGYDGIYALKKGDFSGMAEFAKYGDPVMAQNRILSVLTKDMIDYLDKKGFVGV